jgi:hypothetical protein
MQKRFKHKGRIWEEQNGMSSYYFLAHFTVHMHSFVVVFVNVPSQVETLATGGREKQASDHIQYRELALRYMYNAYCHRGGGGDENGLLLMKLKI